MTSNNTITCPECNDPIHELQKPEQWGIDPITARQEYDRWSIKEYIETRIWPGREPLKTTYGVRINDHPCFIAADKVTWGPTESTYIRSNVTEARIYRSPHVDATESRVYRDGDVIAHVTGNLITHRIVDARKAFGEDIIGVLSEHYLDTRGRQNLAEWIREDMTDIHSRRIGECLALVMATASWVNWQDGYHTTMNSQMNNANLDLDLDDSRVSDHIVKACYSDSDGPFNDRSFQERAVVRLRDLWNEMSMPERRVVYARWINAPIPTIDDGELLYDDEDFE